MEMKRARKGAEVRNKLDGMLYRIESVLCDENNKAVSAQAVEILDDEEVDKREPKTVTITEKNVLAFRVWKDAVPDTVAAGFTVENGILLHDGKPACEQGQLELISVLSSHTGNVLLAAKGGEKVKLMTYEVNRDRFSEIATADSVPQVLYTTPDCGLYAEKHYEDVENTKEDGTKETVKEFLYTSLFAYDNKTRRMANHPERNDYDFDRMVSAKRYRDGGHTDEFDLHVWIPYTERRGEYKQDGTETFKTTHWDHYEIENGELQMLDTVEMDSVPTAKWSYVFRSFVLNDGQKLLVPDTVTIESPLVAEVSKKTLIDITRKEDVYRLTFSDDAFNFTTLVSKKTRDRGLIVTIE